MEIEEEGGGIAVVEGVVCAIENRGWEGRVGCCVVLLRVVVWIARVERDWVTVWTGAVFVECMIEWVGRLVE